MSVFGIAMVKDEADIIGAVLAHMRGQVDELIVADNLSIDGTREVLEAADVTVVDDDDPAYRQSEKMTALAQRAAAAGADWVVPFDADEVWYSPFAPRIADVLADISAQWLCASATLYDHVATGDDPPEEDPTQRMAYRRREPGPLPKVACRVRDDLLIAQGNHAAHYAGGATVVEDQLVVRHFPYRSAEQFEHKVRNGAAAYAASDLPEDAGLHWRRYGRILEAHGPEALGDIFRQWFWIRFPELDGSVVFDPVADAIPKPEVIEHRAWGGKVIRTTPVRG